MNALDKSILAFMFIVSFSSFAASSELSCRNALVPKKRMASVIENLAVKGRLVGQMDPSLDPFFEGIAKGGICGPICGLNVLQAIYEYKGLDTSFFENKLESTQMFMKYLTATGTEDPRIRTNLEDLKKALTRWAADARIRLYTFHHGGLLQYESSIGPNEIVPEFNLRLNSNEIIIADARINFFGGHAVIILEVNPSTRKIRYLDPNFPNQVFESRYVIDRSTVFKGKKIKSIRLLDFYPFKDAGSELGLLGDLLSISVLQ